MSRRRVEQWLAPPLPEGSVRKRLRCLSPGSPSLSPGSPSPSSVNANPIELLPITTIISFDGACRGNNRSIRSCSGGVFCTNYQHSFTSRFHLPQCDTNNAAEIEACCVACETINNKFELCLQNCVEEIVVRGDSTHVIHTVTSGLLCGYQVRDGLPNSKLWCRLAKNVNTLSEHCSSAGIQLRWEWIPRWQNLEADNLANAVLDGLQDHQIQHITSPPCSDLDISQLASLCLRALPKKRRRSIRTLPDSLALHWKRTIETIMAQFSEELVADLMFLLPLLLHQHISRISNRADFKRMMIHIGLLSQQQYLSEQLNAFLATTNIPENDFQPSSVPPVNVLCARGLHSKILKEPGIEIAQPDDLIHQRVTELFPQAALPPPIAAKPVELSFGDIVRAMRGMKRGSSPGLSGWTRELLYPLFFLNPSDSLIRSLTRFFSRIVNNVLSDEIRTAITTGILIVFRYLETNKLRPIVILDYLIRVACRTALKLCNTPRKSFSTDCVEAVRWAQARLDEGYQILSIDGTNAFNNVSRKEAFEELATDDWAPLHPLLNLLYSQPSTVICFSSNMLPGFEVPVTRGSRQGCVTGTLFLAAAIRRAFRRLHFPPTVQLKVIADDIAISDHNVIQHYPTVIDALKHVGLDYTGPKSKLFSTPVPLSTLPSSVSICTGPSKYLGGLISAQPSSSTQLKTAAQHILSKAQRRTEQLLSLDTTVMNKLNILRYLTVWLMYYVSTVLVDAADTLWVDIDTMHAQVVQSIIHTKLPPHHVQWFFNPLEDGGWGLLPLSLLGPVLRTTNGFKNYYSFWRRSVLQRSAMTPTNWKNVWPKDRFKTINDEACILYLRFLTNTLPGLQRLPCSAIDVSDISSHLSDCTTCMPRFYHLRHTAVVHMLQRTCRYHNIPISSISNEPLPGNTRGGADLQILLDFGFDDIDVTISYHKKGGLPESTAAASSFSFKKRKYRDHQNVTGHHVTPFVLLTDGHIEKRTLQRIETWSNMAPFPSDAFRDITCNCQYAMIKAISSSLSSLYVADTNVANPPLSSFYVRRN